MTLVPSFTCIAPTPLPPSPEVQPSQARLIAFHVCISANSSTNRAAGSPVQTDVPSRVTLLLIISRQIAKMAENIPPNPSTKPAPSANDRGLPYYEKLRRDLRDTITKKRLLDRNLQLLEAQIFTAETNYLEDTSAAGNIVKGFDNYIKAAATTASSNVNSGTISGAAAGGARRKVAVSDGDRVFSKSSVGYSMGRDGDSGTPAGGSAASTPRVGTPSGSFNEKGQDKKKKKGGASAAADEEDGRSSKRQKITFSRSKRDDD